MLWLGYSDKLNNIFPSKDMIIIIAVKSIQVQGYYNE